MSNSTDSLKKKVCVTVFLDELFEEVLDEDWKDSKQTESKAPVEDKQLKELSRIESSNGGKVKFCPSENSKQVQIQFRPRKHRKESKFSKNHYDSFKNKLKKYGYESRGKTEDGRYENFGSGASDSDFGLAEFLDLNKRTFGSSRSSFSQSSLDTREESHVSMNPVASTMRICPKREKNYRRKAICNKSTQFNGVDPGEGERKLKEMSDDVLAEERALAWSKTERQMRLILAKAMNRHAEKEVLEEDRLRNYYLSTILKECVRTGESVSSKSALVNADGVFCDPSGTLQESDEYELCDSYTRVVPHDQKNIEAKDLGAKTVSARARKMIDAFESDPSETNCTHYAKLIGLRSHRKDSEVCYTLQLQCEDCDNEETDKQNENSDALESVVYSDTTSRESSFESVQSKDSREKNSEQTALIRVAKAEALNARLKDGKRIRSKGGLLVSAKKNLAAADGRNKNFAKGDTFEKSLNQDSKFILNVKEKEKLIVCDEILKKVVESNVIRNEIVVNRAEVKLNSAELAKTEAKIGNSVSPEELAEVYLKKNPIGNLDKSMTDAESEMVFAESENFCDDRDYLNDTLAPSVSINSSSQPNDICVLEFEDKLSNSKILRRMKTVEILGDNPLSEMKNISTEVILICENISSNEVCLEAWQSSASTLKSVTELGQCYLKDAKDSAMYLVEIPLHFVQADQKNLPDSDRISKTSDSE